jgi:hypothetical protein
VAAAAGPGVFAWGTTALVNSATGRQHGESDGALLTFTEHFNGQAWSVAPSLDQGELGDAPDSTFQAITSAAPHTLFAVGSLEMPTFCCFAALAERSGTG